MRLTRRWPTLLTSSWLRSVGYFCGKCWQMQMLGKNVLMSEEFEGPHGQSMLHSKLRKSESLKFVWTFWTKLFTPISILPALYVMMLYYCIYPGSLTLSYTLTGLCQNWSWILLCNIVPRHHCSSVTELPIFQSHIFWAWRELWPD